MKLSISEARKRLPELVRRVRKSTGAKVEITVGEKVVAELRGTTAGSQASVAAKKLLSLMRKMPKHRGRKTNVSGRVNTYLYGPARTQR